MKIHNKYFDTYPVIFHHHGQGKWSNHSMGSVLKKRFFDHISNGDNGSFRDRKLGQIYPIPPSNVRRSDIGNKLTIFMVTNLKEVGSAARCLDYYGINYVLVGEEIDRFDGEKKFKAIIDFIPKVETEYVMLLDSDDIFITDDLTNVVDTFEEVCDCKMLFQAEGWNFPKGDWDIYNFEISVVDGSNPYKHLNSGVWIANTSFLKSIYDDLKKIVPHVPGDQPIFKKLYKDNYPNIKIDSSCEFFQSLAWSDWFRDNYPKVLDLEADDG